MVWIKTTVRLIIVLLLQFLILNRLQFLGVCHPMVYVVCLLMFPLQWNAKADMVLGALIGLVADLFFNSPGIHMAACVAVMAVRREIIRRLIMEPERIKGDLDLHTLGTKCFVQYTLALILIHHTMVFVLNAWSWHMLGWTLLEILVSSTVTFLLILVYNKAIDKKQAV